MRFAHEFTIILGFYWGGLNEWCVRTHETQPLIMLQRASLTYTIIMGALHGRTLGQLRRHEIDGVRKDK